MPGHPASREETSPGAILFPIFFQVHMSTVWIVTPWLPWTVVGFMTHYQRFINVLEIKVKINNIFFKLMDFVVVVVWPDTVSCSVTQL